MQKKELSPYDIYITLPIYLFCVIYVTRRMKQSPFMHYSTWKEGMVSIILNVNRMQIYMTLLLNAI